MNNKVLINVEIPEIDGSFDIFIPVNELVWRVSKLVIKSISDLTGIALNPQEPYIFINKNNNKVYENNEIILNTDIRNGTELITIKQKDVK